MDTQFPTVKIMEHDFFVDIKQNEFREVKDATNKIPFHEVQDNGDHLLIAFDKKTKNAFQGDITELIKSKDVKVVRLPSWKEIVRSNGNEVTETPVMQTSGPKFLPIVSISGTDFTADMRLAELRQTAQPHNRISFDVFESVSDKNLGFLYDPKKKNAFEGTKEELNSRRDIQLIQLPPMAELNSDTSQKRFEAKSIGIEKNGQSIREEVAPNRKRKGRGV